MAAKRNHGEGKKDGSSGIGLNIGDYESKNKDPRNYVIDNENFQKGRLDMLRMSELIYYLLFEGIAHPNKVTEDDIAEIKERLSKKLEIVPSVMTLGAGDVLNHLGRGIGNFESVDLTGLKDIDTLDAILEHRPENFRAMFRAAYHKSHPKKGQDSLPVFPDFLGMPLDDLRKLRYSAEYSHIWHQTRHKSFEDAVKQGLHVYGGKFELLSKKPLGPTVLFYRKGEATDMKNPPLYALIASIKSKESFEEKIYGRIIEAIDTSSKYSSSGSLPRLSYDSRGSPGKFEFHPGKHKMDMGLFTQNLRVIDDVFRFAHVNYIFSSYADKFEKIINTNKRWQIGGSKDTKKSDDKDINFLKYDIALADFYWDSHMVKMFSPDSFEVQLFSVPGYVIDKLGEGKYQHPKYKSEKSREVAARLASPDPFLADIVAKLTPLLEELGPHWPSLESLPVDVKKYSGS